MYNEGRVIYLSTVRCTDNEFASNRPYCPWQGSWFWVRPASKLWKADIKGGYIDKRVSITMDCRKKQCLIMFSPAYPSKYEASENDDTGWYSGSWLLTRYHHWVNELQRMFCCLMSILPTCLILIAATYQDGISNRSRSDWSSLKVFVCMVSVFLADKNFCKIFPEHRFRQMWFTQNLKKNNTVFEWQWQQENCCSRTWKNLIVGFARFWTFL